LVIQYTPEVLTKGGIPRLYGLTLGVGREEAGDVVEEGEDGGTEPLGIGRKIQLTAKNASFVRTRKLVRDARVAMNGERAVSCTGYFSMV
jgi:hypothetical protein